ncbi:hypothetical protein HZ994_09495 [Akkermansiaceae bacterium]|nr:hypothetical protein HZ994_09495 [Akkermansiaceae bacterium]
MKTTATPETNELIRTQLARVGITPTALAAKLTLKCEDLERERDEARKIAEELRDLVPWSESEPWNFSWENVIGEPRRCDSQKDQTASSASAPPACSMSSLSKGEVA